MATFSTFPSSKLIDGLQRIKRSLPIQLSNIGVNYFTGTFKAQGFDGKAWKEVNRRIEGTSEYKYPKTTQLSRRKNPILVGVGKGQSGGKLRREVNNSARLKTWTTISFGVSDATPYAKYHNEGTGKIPQRKFMGQSRQLNKLIKDKIRQEIQSIFK